MTNSASTPPTPLTHFDAAGQAHLACRPATLIKYLHDAYYLPMGITNLLPGMAVGYDWCYNRLTPTQRAQFQTQMEQWADWVWPETNPTRATAWTPPDAPSNRAVGRVCNLPGKRAGYKPAPRLATAAR